MRGRAGPGRRREDGFPGRRVPLLGCACRSAAGACRGGRGQGRGGGDGRKRGDGRRGAGQGVTGSARGRAGGLAAGRRRGRARGRGRGPGRGAPVRAPAWEPSPPRRSSGPARPLGSRRQVSPLRRREGGREVPAWSGSRGSVPAGRVTPGRRGGGRGRRHPAPTRRGCRPAPMSPAAAGGKPEDAAFRVRVARARAGQPLRCPA